MRRRISYDVERLPYLSRYRLESSFKVLIFQQLMQMKQMLASWRSVTEQEYPQYVHIIPHPDEIDLANIENGGVITDTCNSAQKENQLIAAYVNGVVHCMF